MINPGPFAGRPHLGGKRPGPAGLGGGAYAYGEYWERVVLHLDMNAFFASVEERANPLLAGKPVLIVGSKKWRSVVSTANYEAKRYGISAGMSSIEAISLCPHAELVPADGNKYASALRQIVEIAERFSPDVEVYSIDEVFLDLTNTFQRWETPRGAGRAFRDAITNDLGLPCSVGVAPNKMLAKLCSGMEKPNGLTVVKPSLVSELLEDLPATKLAGIGRKMEGHLARLGITTCGDLGRTPMRKLRSRFGIVGEVLHNMGCGIDRRPVVAYDRVENAKSVGHSVTLRHDIQNIEEIRRVLLMLSEKVSRRMRKGDYAGRCVAAYCRYPDFYTIGRSHRLKRYVDDGIDIYRAAYALLPDDMEGRGVRLLGVSMSMLIRDCKSSTLFDERRDQLTGTIDHLNEKYGGGALTRASITRGNTHRITTLNAIHPNPSPLRAVFGMDIG